MRWTRRFLLSLAVLVTATFGIVGGVVSAIWVPFLMADIKANAFYASHPMLRAMRDAPTHFTSKGDRPAVTKILLNRVPPGTSRSEAIQILATENIKCDRTMVSLHADRVLVCGPIKRPCSVARWYIELNFDEKDTLAGGRALSLKATCES